MNLTFLENNLKSLYLQRNLFAVLSLILSVVLLIESIFLFSKSERIIVSPPVVEKEFWVEGHAVSSTYLEQFGYFLGELLLSKSSQSAPAQREIILRHTDSSFSGNLRKKLFEEEEMLRNRSASYSFYPVNVQVDQQGLKVTITGERVAFAAGKQVSSKEESYVLSFSYAGYRLLLKGVEFTEGEK